MKFDNGSQRTGFLWVKGPGNFWGEGEALCILIWALIIKIYIFTFVCYKLYLKKYCYSIGTFFPLIQSPNILLFPFENRWLFSIPTFSNKGPGVISGLWHLTPILVGPRSHLPGLLQRLANPQDSSSACSHTWFNLFPSCVLSYLFISIQILLQQYIWCL